MDWNEYRQKMAEVEDRYKAILDPLEEASWTLIYWGRDILSALDQMQSEEKAAFRLSHPTSFDLGLNQVEEAEFKFRLVVERATAERDVMIERVRLRMENAAAIAALTAAREAEKAALHAAWEIAQAEEQKARAEAEARRQQAWEEEAARAASERQKAWDEAWAAAAPTPKVDGDVKQAYRLFMRAFHPDLNPEHREELHPIVCGVNQAWDKKAWNLCTVIAEATVKANRVLGK